MRNDYSVKPPVVLVVDDEPEMLEIYKDHLQKHGFVVESSVNGSEADYKITHQTFDIIITDLNMPYIDGIVFVKNIRNSPFNKNTTVVVVSGFLSKASIVKLASFKVTKIYTKPLQVKIFLKELSEIIGFNMQSSTPSNVPEQDEIEVR